MIATTGNIRTEEQQPKKEVPMQQWIQSLNFRHFVNNSIPSSTTSVLQQQWVSSDGVTKWVDIPVVFSKPTPLKDFKS